MKLFTDQLANKQPETDIRVEVPSSKSSLQIKDFPAFGLSPKHDAKGHLIPLTEEQLIAILVNSPFAKDFAFYENSRPRLTRVSPCSNVGTLWFDIEDSCVGLQMRNLVGRSFMYGPHHLTISPALKHVGVPQCNRCWRFGHPANPPSMPDQRQTLSDMWRRPH